MRSVLGIDAAWTAKNPSGISLIIETSQGWRSRALAPSYASFMALSESRPVDWLAKYPGEKPHIDNLIDACKKLIGRAPDVIAVDMPLSTIPITGYRAADRELSRVFWEYDCSVRPPSEKMPGPIGQMLSNGCREAGWPLATRMNEANIPALIEVYPHAAIVRLMKLSQRLAYKISSNTKFWRDELPLPDAAQRAQRLVQNFMALKIALDREIDYIGLPLPEPGTAVQFSRLKNYEDALDALVCAWVGAEYLAGRVEAYGNETAAIWVPKPR